MPGENSGNQSGYDTPSGPEHRLLAWYQENKKVLSPGDKAIFDMLTQKQKDGTLDSGVLMNTSSANAFMVNSVDAIKNKYKGSRKLSITETSKGSGIYKVLNGTKDTTPEFYYVPPKQLVKPKNKKVVVKPTVPATTASSTAVSSNNTVVSAKTIPQPQMFYSNDFKVLEELQIDQLLTDIVQNSKDLLSSYDYISIDEEYFSSGSDMSGDSEEIVLMSTPAPAVQNIIDYALNEKISRLGSISSNFIKEVFNKIKNFKSLNKYDSYLDLFTGPFYDKDGNAYYNLTLNFDPFDGIMEDSYKIKKRELN